MPTLDLDAICNPPETTWHVHDPQPIYRFDDYIKLYERHCVQAGIPFDSERFDPKVYKYEPLEEVSFAENGFRCPEFGDRLGVRLDVDENDKVKLVVNTVLRDLFESSWSKGEKPSMNNLVVAFKKLGADDTFLKQIIKRHGQIQSVCKKFDLDRVFKPKSKPKTKTAKPPKPSVVVDEEEENENERDDEEDEEEEEFEGLDVEANEDEEDQACQDDEEFIDDMDED